ncbi:methyltransferase domain-containing protein [Brevibacillus sp. RS1.1]|uniref:methyltransferase domain-containing protein n=1 Tax=Brevibacillus sp. RS1.1 TaxID=2738982 RepID=UPI00156B2D55|nr:methyltransferase domain-containing protein [Brevibacillus sp. RS1.1]NRR01742.1 methyltransferase domain-containing protein [Brevibacillus sp. RS1.1]
MTIYSCRKCKFRYDEWLGDTKNGVPPGVPFPHLAGSVCTECEMNEEGRHLPLPETKYTNVEATYYDQFAGKASIAFYRNWLLREAEQSPVSVLEMGVGTGRIAIELARNDLPVCGVDWSPDMLELATKKKRRILKGKEELLELVEQNMWELELGQQFTHVLLPEGIFQQATCRDKQRQLLSIIHDYITEDGTVAIDLLLPPVKNQWATMQRKFVFPDRMVYQKVEGETSLLDQKFRYTLTYETFLDQIEQPRYRVEREMALLLPTELELLLEGSGFRVIYSRENVFHKQDFEPSQADEGYDMDRWQHGGYPFSEPVGTPGGATRWTILAKKISSSTL